MGEPPLFGYTPGEADFGGADGCRHECRYARHPRGQWVRIQIAAPRRRRLQSIPGAKGGSSRSRAGVKPCVRVGVGIRTGLICRDRCQVWIHVTQRRLALSQTSGARSL